MQGGVIWGEDVAKWDAAGALCVHCQQQHRDEVEDARHFACCPRWDRVWRATQELRLQTGAAIHDDRAVAGAPLIAGMRRSLHRVSSRL